MAHKVKQCASNEGETCPCSGVIYYGEKFSRDSQLYNPDMERKQISFAEMLQFPFLTKDMSHGFMLQCSIKEIKGQFSDLDEVKYPKQCFCDETGNHDQWEF